MLALPNPLHPLFVHLPIALTLLLPIVAIGAMWAVRKGARPRRAWGIAVATFALLTGSAWAALQTGQREEERVEEVVAESAIETHEEAAEAFLMASGIVLLVAGAGLLNGLPGRLARGASVVGAVGLLVGGWQVGHTGGALVYKEGAASAYTATAGGVERAGTVDVRGTTERDDDDERK